MRVERISPQGLHMGNALSSGAGAYMEAFVLPWARLPFKPSRYLADIVPQPDGGVDFEYLRGGCWADADGEYLLLFETPQEGRILVREDGRWLCKYSFGYTLFDMRSEGYGMDCSMDMAVTRMLPGNNRNAGIADITRIDENAMLLDSTRFERRPVPAEAAYAYNRHTDAYDAVPDWVFAAYADMWR